MGTHWSRVSGILRALTWVAALGLTFYVAIAVFGLVGSSSVFYAVFIVGTALMTGLYALRELVQARVEEVAPRFFALRLANAGVATLFAVAGGLYIAFEASRLQVAAPYFKAADLVMGALFTVGLTVLTWIHWGAMLTVFLILGIAYFFLGHLLENPLLSHPRYEPSFVMNYLGLSTTDGFFYFVQVASDQVYFLIVYAAVLLGAGMFSMVLEVGRACGRHVAGGSAMPALVGSGVVAAVMGNAVSNAILVGRFTIPMMIKYGYRPAMAAAVEASASSSGQIMPPVLGLAAFMIASLLSMPYVDVALASLVPGLLFLSGVTIAIFVYAKRHRLPRLAETVDTAMIWRLLPTFVVSFVAVIVLLVNYISPSIAGLAGAVIVVVMCLFQGKYRPNARQFAAALEEGLMLAALLSLLIIAIGPLGQVMLTTGLSGRLGILLVQYLPDSQFIMLVGAMVLALFLGLGLPTAVAYLIAFLALGSFMQQIGIMPLAAHFFIFYFAVFSGLTPPVAETILVAGKIANAGQWESAVESMKICLSTFIVPFAFVYNTQLLAFPHVSVAMLIGIVEILLIQWTTSIALYGYFRRNLGVLERSAFWAATLAGFWAMATAPVMNTVIFLAAVAAIMGWVWLRPETDARRPRAAWWLRSSRRPADAAHPIVQPSSPMAPGQQTSAEPRRAPEVDLSRGC